MVALSQASDSQDTSVIQLCWMPVSLNLCLGKCIGDYHLQCLYSAYAHIVHDFHSRILSTCGGMSCCGICALYQLQSSLIDVKSDVIGDMECMM